MKKTASARFSIKSWDEKPYSEGKDLPKMTRASVDKAFTGDIDGEGHVEYVMMYRSDGTAAFVGLERITGRIAGRNGSFVLQRTGIFEDGQAKESYSVVTGSGTGGSAVCAARAPPRSVHAADYPFALNYEVD